MYLKVYKSLGLRTISITWILFCLTVREHFCISPIRLSVVLQRILSDRLQRPICNPLHQHRVVPAPWVTMSVLQEQKLTLAVETRTRTRAGEGQCPRAVVHVATEVVHGVSGVFSGLTGGGTVRGKRPPHWLPPPAAQDLSERPAELAAVRRVDDGVHAAVEVTEPEDELEDDFWRTQISVEGNWKRRTQCYV